MMLKHITILENHPNFSHLMSHISNGKTPLSVTGVNAIHKGDVLLSMYKKSGTPLCILTEDDLSAQKLTEELNDLYGSPIAKEFITRDFIFQKVSGASKEYEQIRISTLAELLYKNIPIVVSSMEGALQRTIPKTVFCKNTLSLSLGDTTSISALCEKLLLSGYQRKDQIDGTHQFSSRGGILDVYPSGETTPLRIEFFGDEIDSLSQFDLETQRRDTPLSSAIIPPATEVLAEDLQELSNRLSCFLTDKKETLSIPCQEQIQQDIHSLQSGEHLPSLDSYMDLIYPKFHCLLDYFDTYLLGISEPAQGLTNYNNRVETFTLDAMSMVEQGHLCPSLLNFYLSPLELEKITQCIPTILLDTFVRANTSFRPKDILDFSGISLGSWNGNLQFLKEDLTDFLENNFTLLLLGGEEKSCKQLERDLQDMGIDCMFTPNPKSLAYNKVYVTPGALSSGFYYKEEKIAVLTVQKNKLRPPKKKKKIKPNHSISSLEDIAYGDLLVHNTHGIGRFEGIKNITIQHTQKDYIKIKYHGSDTLYLPVTQLDLVSKYIGAKDNHRMKLNKLHAEDWKKTKSRVYKAVQDMAKELILLYAKREQMKGFAFGKDTEWQEEFEAAFPFAETDDQLRSVAEIKKDMEKNTPMDRLLCGDVGFGKTEVALRGAFKCVMDGKQVALLVPTTILAWQHFQTISKRVEKYPMKIELLSRFRTPKQQKQIIEKLAAGEIDILIGTHRILQKDIQFKDLGLAIIDEEQRFGVEHKEKFKESFSHVDVLTLSATPIPRTLNMAMSGIRDMSLIEEPPLQRQPVQTYVIEHDPPLLMDAIKKEIRRGGQVYYIHNKVESIESVATHIREWMGESIRVAVAHGKMGEAQLSKIWRELIDGEIDVLVCTTIIETGVDVANCNTLIVENSDHMGLSQLYQLRGRVGRSSRRGFCYLTFSKGKVLTEISAKRLSAIKEFTNFGSGFKIALRDLEIRGAGNILSKNQHGHLESVGYDMYIKLLHQAVSVEKGEKSEIQMNECLIDISMDAYIPEDYIKDLPTRIDVYKKIALITTKEDAYDVVDEFIDRFGEPPPCVKGLIDVALLRNLAAKANIYEIKQTETSILFYVTELNMDQISRTISNFQLAKVFVNASKKPYLSIQLPKGASPLFMIENFLQELHKEEIA